MLAEVKLQFGWDSKPGMTFECFWHGINLQCIPKAENTNYADNSSVILYSKEIKSHKKEKPESFDLIKTSSFISCI